MEVKLDKRYPVTASLEQAWSVLADLRATAGCMPGAQITEQLDATHYKGTVRSKVGPAVMNFAGEVEVLAVDETTRSVRLLARGADKAGSSATMDLKVRLEEGEEQGRCVLVGQASIVVGGKLAQFGSRLLVPVSDALLVQYAGNFGAAAAAVTPVSSERLVVGAPGSSNEPTHLNALTLLWSVFKRWLARLFGQRR